MRGCTPSASAAAVTAPSSGSPTGSGESAAGRSASPGAFRNAAFSSNPGMDRQAIMGTYVLHERTFPCQTNLRTGAPQAGYSFTDRAGHRKAGGGFMSRSRLTALVGALALVITAAAAAASPFPDVVPLPNGWQPEGVEAGTGHTLYVGSVATGAVRQVDVQSGKSFTLVQSIPGRAATGIEYDKRSKRLFVSGASTGQAFVYDERNGTPLTAYTFATAPTFINDAALTKDAIYFTDSQKPQLYRVPVGKSLAPQSAVHTIPLSGDYMHQPGFNLNGIVATKDGRTLIAVQSNTASLFKIDPQTGVADKIEFTGGDAAAGDGLLLEGRTLHVVQNQLNRVEVVNLAADLGSGTVVRMLTNPSFAVPTTIDRVNGRLYLPNAKFGVGSPGTAPYEVVSLGKQ